MELGWCDEFFGGLVSQSERTQGKIGEKNYN